MQIKNEITIQAVTESDALPLDNFFKQACEETLDGKLIIKKSQQIKLDLALIALYQGHIIGYLNFFIPFPSIAELKHIGHLGIVVLKGFWNQSIAEMLLNNLEIFAQQKGILKLESTLLTNNLPGVMFCKKNGFTIEGIHTKAINTSDQFFDQFYISKNL